MSGVTIVQVTDDDTGIRLDRWFKRHHPEITHGRLSKLLRTGQVRVDGSRAKASLRLETGQDIRLPPLGEAPPRPAEQPWHRHYSDQEVADLRATILHRDETVLVINKPAGLAVQGGSKTSHHLDAMLDALRFEAKERPRLVHRLDKDTSGVLALARTAKAATRLAAAFKSHDAEKVYWAIVTGVPRPRDGRIDMRLEKRPGIRGEQVVADEAGKRAITYYRTVENAARKAAWLALYPETGRTHQLRVHCAQLGTPVLGDGKYGGKEAFFDGAEEVARQLHLHARAIRLPHPAGGLLSVIAPLPPHMVATWRYLEFDQAQEADPFIDEMA